MGGCNSREDSKVGKKTLTTNQHLVYTVLASSESRALRGGAKNHDAPNHRDIMEWVLARDNSVFCTPFS